MQKTINSLVNELTQLSISSYNIGLISKSLKDDYINIIHDIYNKKTSDETKKQMYQELYNKIKNYEK